LPNLQSDAMGWFRATQWQLHWSYQITTSLRLWPICGKNHLIHSFLFSLLELGILDVFNSTSFYFVLLGPESGRTNRFEKHLGVKLGTTLNIIRDGWWDLKCIGGEI
jgi:hypothetical protein